MAEENSSLIFFKTETRALFIWKTNMWLRFSRNIGVPLLSKCNFVGLQRAQIIEIGNKSGHEVLFGFYRKWKSNKISEKRDILKRWSICEKILPFAGILPRKEKFRAHWKNWLSRLPDSKERISQQQAYQKS